MHGRRERTRARLWAAEQALDAIGTALDERTLCEELARFLCPGLCDAVAVDVLPPAGSGGVPRAADAPERAAVRGRAALLDAPDARPARGRTAPACLCLPMRAHGQVQGMLLAARAGRGFSRDETDILRHAARLTALLIVHARSHAAARGTALDLQRALLAEPGRPHPNLELATRYLPSGRGSLVGGDWFETVRLHFGRTLLVVGDVMGHGVDAAVDMNAYRSALRYVASADLPPHRVLRHLDATMAATAERRPATCLLVRVDPARSTATFTGAGHLPPVLFTPDGEARLVPVPVGPPLGTGVGGYEAVTRRLSGGETLLLFTDGLVERRDEDIDASLARLTGRWTTPGIGAEELLDAVLARCDAEHAEDDVAVLAARVRRRPAAADGTDPAPV
ncbi:SpoIIE family protein phosphatase [Streptomyces genisteinicus]|uniref:SpoIIE family protein phosphatase n=2 Tax=Streptomyces genisteinicus TaxID=2768068 RepID=A0A7H0I4J3_9ACTN|nr:SpoIIE family protein phosphatase [Streptomyces genisteinicus]